MILIRKYPLLLKWTCVRCGHERHCDNILLREQRIHVTCFILFQVAYKKRERAQKRKEMEVLMKDNLLNILTVPGTPIRCETQDELEQLNKSNSQHSFDKNNLYPQEVFSTAGNQTKHASWDCQKSLSAFQNKKEIKVKRATFDSGKAKCQLITT